MNPSKSSSASTQSTPAEYGGRLHYALIAGSCAALGSFFGKLTTEESRQPFLTGTVFEQLNDGWILTVLAVALMLLSNGMVWTFFVKALHSRGGSVVATVECSTTNYLLSAFFGCLVFGETTSPLWWVGTSISIMGLLCMGTQTDDPNTNKKTS